MGHGTAASNRHTHSAHLPIGLLSIEKTAKLFYWAAWWIVTAQSTSIKDAPALSNDLASMVVGVAWHPTVQTVEIERNDNFHHNVNIIAADFMRTFLQNLHEHNYARARRYVQQVEARQRDALNLIKGMFGDAGAHNANLAHQATMGMKVMSETIFYCELAIAVGVCILSAGLAPAFLGGATLSATTQGIAGFAISEGYGIACEVVNNANSGKSESFGEAAKAWALAPPTKVSHTTGAIGFATLARTVKLDKHIEHQNRLVGVAKVQIMHLNRALGQNIGPLHRAVLNEEKTRIAMQQGRAAAARSGLNAERAGVDGVGRGVAVFQLAADWYNAFAALKERNKIIDS